jgi:hypothetical protein
MVFAWLLAVTIAAPPALTGCATPDGAVWTPPAAASSATPANATPDRPSPTASADGDSAQQERFTAAEAMLRGKPGTIGIIVRDRRSGAYWRAGVTDHLAWTASTIKLALVTSLLERARSGEITLDATGRKQIDDILTLSSNQAATALWDRYGKDAQVPRFQKTYGMTGLTFVAGFPRFWGHMKCTAEDLMHLMSYVLDKLHPTDRAYLVNRMRHVGPIQRWGVYAAGSATRSPSCTTCRPARASTSAYTWSATWSPPCSARQLPPR